MYNDENPFERSWAVIGFDYDRAEQIIDDIEKSCGKEVLRRHRMRSDLATFFTDGTYVKWAKYISHEHRRAFKYGKLWCDKNLDPQYYDYVTQYNYRGKREDIVWL